MHINTNKKLLSLLLACTICVSSCNKDGEAPLDVEAPEVSFQTIEEDKNVKGQVTLDLNASDNNGVTKIEIYVNNTLIATITEAPYTFTWNTTGYPDGKYAVKAIAYDKDGNIKETIINVNVLNRLLKVIVPETAMVPWNTNTTLSGWVFLSDSNGKTLGVKKFNNGDILEFQSHENFNEDKVFLNVLRISNDTYTESSYTSASIRTTAVNVNEEITLTAMFPKIDNNIVGTSSILINNIPEEHYSVSSGHSQIEGNKGGISTVGKTLTSMTLNYNLYQSPVNNLVNVQFSDGQASKYKFYQNFATSQNLEVDYSSLSTMTGIMDFSFPGAENFMTFLMANRVAGDNSTRYQLGFKFEPSGKIYYPENIFAEYDTYISFSENGVRRTIYNINGSAPITTFQPLEVTNNILASNIDNYSFTSSGTYDIYSLSFNYSAASETNPSHRNYFNWNIEGSITANTSGILPEVPLAIIQENQFLIRENLAFTGISFTDYVGITSEDYFIAYLNGQANSVNKGYTHVSYPVSTTTARKSISKKMDLREINEMINNPNGFYPVR